MVSPAAGLGWPGDRPTYRLRSKSGDDKYGHHATIVNEILRKFLVAVSVYTKIGAHHGHIASADGRADPDEEGSQAHVGFVPEASQIQGRSIDHELLAGIDD